MAKRARSKISFLEGYEFYLDPTTVSGKKEITDGQRTILGNMQGQLDNVTYVDVGETMKMYTIDGVDGRTDEILEQVIDLAKKRKMKVYPMLELLYATGARIGDIVDLDNDLKFQKGMKVQDLDFKNGFIIFRGAKRNVERIVGMPDYLSELLQQHIKENGYVGDDYLFKSEVVKTVDDIPVDNNVPKKQDTFRNPFNELIEEVTGSRESGLSLHKSFRNGWIESVRSVVDGIPVDNVEAATGQYVGHKSLTTTDEYTGLITGQVVKPLSERKRAILSTFGYAANKLNIMANNQSKFKGGGEGKGRKKSTKKKVKNIIPRKATELTAEEIVQDKRNVFGSGKDIDEKVPFGTEEENLGGTIYGEKEINKAYRSLARAATKGTMYKVGKMLNNNAEKAVTLLNLENKNIIKLTNPLDETNASKVINDVLNNRLNYANYINDADSIIKPVMMAALDFSYDPNNLMDTIIKAPKVKTDIKKSMPGATTDQIIDETNWWSNRGLSEYVSESGTDGRRLRTGGLKPEVKLDMDVTRQIYEKLELKAYANNIAQILDGQLQHLTADATGDGIEQITQRHEIFKRAMYSYAEQNPESLIAFSRSQNINVNQAVEEIIEAHSGAAQRVEFSSLSSEDLVKVINDNPDVFPDSPDLFKKYGKEFIYRARLEPYIQFFAEQGILSKKTYIGGVAQDYGSLFGRTLKETSKTLKKESFTPAGVPEKTTRKWLFDFRSNFWDEAGLNLAEGNGLDPETNKTLPLFDLDEFELDTGQNQVLPEPKAELEVDPDNTKRINKIKPRKTPPIRWGVTGLGFLFPQSLAGKIAIEAGLETIMHTSLVDMSGQGQGVYNNNLDKPITIKGSEGEEYIYPNVSSANIRDQLANLSPEALREVTSWDSEDWAKRGYDEEKLKNQDIGFVKRHIEEFKDYGRMLSVVGSSISNVSPLGGLPSTDTGSVDRMEETIEEVDTAETTDPDLIEYRKATTLASVRPEDVDQDAGLSRNQEAYLSSDKQPEGVYDMFFKGDSSFATANKRNRVEREQAIANTEVPLTQDEQVDKLFAKENVI